MYIVIQTGTNEVISNNEDDLVNADELALNDGGYVIQSDFIFDPELGYRYIPDQNSFEVYDAPPPPEFLND